MKNKTQISKRVAQIYNRLDQQVQNHNNIFGLCKVCGRCCDFGTSDNGHEERFDHRLFITTPEMVYLTVNLGDENIRYMPTTRCPYNVDGKCTIYNYRFAGCRIFHCNTDMEFQSKLSESILKEFKSICTEFQISYRYMELADALNYPATNLCLSEG